MKKFLAAVITALMLASGAVAQNNRSYSDTKGASSSGTTADGNYQMWFLSAVKNNRTDIVSKVFQKEPWKAQDSIDVYQDAGKKASISIFCVGVDMGNLEVVKQFIAAGYGPNDNCKIQLFTDEWVAVSKVDKTIKGTYESTVGVGGGLFGLFGGSAVTVPNKVDLYTTTTNNEQVIKTYFVSPLDFASGKMFDYLWSKGFRSENLLDMVILGEAVKAKKQNVIDYIVANIGKVKNKPAKISDEKLKELIATARNNDTSVAYKYLTGEFIDISMDLDGSSAYKLEQSLKKLSRTLETYVAKDIKNKADTLGYAAIYNNMLETKKIKEREQQRKKLDERKKYIARKFLSVSEAKDLPKEIYPYIDETSKIWMRYDIAGGVNAIISLKNNTSWIFFHWYGCERPECFKPKYYMKKINSLDEKISCLRSRGFWSYTKTARKCLNLKPGNPLLPK